MADVHESVKEYYGKRLQRSDDLQTNACTTFGSSMPAHIRQAIGECHDEVVSKYYGCGLVVPEALRGAHVLDLGSGAGRDCFVLSKLVGQDGRVVGVDMTEEQLAVARRHVDYHTEKFGYSKANVEFRFGYIERLGEAGLEDNSFDVIVSNCVVNLVPDKQAVLREAYRVLREGGELYFSDVYASERVPEALRKDPVLWGECISGALYWEDLVDIALSVGFARPSLVRAAAISVDNPEQQQKLGDIQFVSATYRLFKPPSGDAGQESVWATYNGGIEYVPAELVFDATTTFHTGKATILTAQMASVLRKSRFSSFFTFVSTTDGDGQPSLANLDPFKLAKNAPDAPGGGCCGGATSSSKTSSSGCCAPSLAPSGDNSTSSGCCNPSVTPSSDCGVEKRASDGCCDSNQSAAKKKCC